MERWISSKLKLVCLKEIGAERIGSRLSKNITEITWKKFRNKIIYSNIKNK